MGKRLIPCPLHNGTAGIAAPGLRLFVLRLRIHFFVNRHPAFMPDNLIRIRPENEPRRIQRVIIEKRISLLYRPLDRRIMVGIFRLFDREINMELRSRSPAVFFFHMIPAWCRCITDLFKERFQLLEGDPFGRIVGVIVITIHDDDI